MTAQPASRSGSKRLERKRPGPRALFCFWAIAASGLPGCRPDSIPVTIRAGLLLDGRGGELRDALITIRDGRIRAVGPWQGSPVTHDLSRLTVLPGLIDAHVHISGYINSQGRMSGGDGETAAQKAAGRAGNALATLRAGFTTVASMGSARDQELRNAIDKDSIAGPKILTSLSPIGDTTVTSRQITRLLLEQKAAGSDFIKIFATNSLRGGGTPVFTTKELSKLCREARRLGLRSVIHTQSDASLEQAALAGCDQVEHGMLATPKALAGVARKGVWFDPQCGLVFDNYLQNRTAVLGMPGFDSGAMALMERLRPTQPRLLQTALAIPGLKVLYGTDATAGAHGRNAEDLVCWVREAGQPPMEALVAATSRNAEALGLGDEIGSIAPGYQADIIGLEGNPLQQIEAVRRVRFVMRGGKVFVKQGAREPGS